jgi:hypothetical protein
VKLCALVEEKKERIKFKDTVFAFKILRRRPSKRELRLMTPYWLTFKKSKVIGWRHK